jgi:CheY-specific phosphatase CheX
MKELCDGFLSGVEIAELGHRHEMPDSLLGAFVQVVCPEGAVLLGITGTSEACDGIARRMLGMDPDEPIEESDANDAMGEIINIAAGTVKTKLSPQLGSIELGLPLFLSGRLRAVGHIAVELTEVRIGSREFSLIVFALTGK